MVELEREFESPNAIHRRLVIAALTSEQVIALAPDAASAKAGAALASPRKWSGTGRDAEARVVWGACQGSGASPYQTRVDLDAPAFHCTCPSRKFPCKHALGLLLLLAASPQSVPASEPPQWVVEWIESRAQRAEKKAAKQEARADAGAEPVDREAQEQRAAAREKKVANGMSELALWLRDLIRTGMATVQGRPSSFWDDMAARLVDAQAPGAARLVRQLGALRTSGERWPERMLLHLARLHLLVEGYQRLPTLAPEAQATVRARVGWTASDADVSLLPVIGDRWVVVGQLTMDDERLRARRTWLVGATSGRVALLLHFAHGKAPFADSLPPVGSELRGELAFLIGDVNRAVVRTRDNGASQPTHKSLPVATIHLRDATAPFAEALARDPWTEQVLLVVQDVVPSTVADEWFVRDGAGDVVPLAPRFRAAWPMLALSGGHPVWMCGEWDGEHLHPLSIGVGDSIVPLAARADG